MMAGLAFVVLDNGAALVITTFRANRMSWNGRTALRAVADLTPLDPMMGASIAGSAIRLFAFRDSHRCEVQMEGS